MQMCSVQILNLMRFQCNTAQTRKRAHIRSQYFCLPIIRQMNEKNKRFLVGFKMAQTWDYPAITAVCCLVRSSSLRSHGDKVQRDFKNTRPWGFDPHAISPFLFSLLQNQTGVARNGDSGGQRLMGSCGKDMDGWVSWLGAVRTEKG